MSARVTSQLHLSTLTALTATEVFASALAGDTEESRLPSELRDWLGRLRLLYGVPFVYLVPNDKLLPPESCRFFFIDRNWTDRLVDGALSVGKTTSREYAHHHALQGEVTEKLDQEEYLIRRRLREPNLEPGQTVNRGGDLTGLLLRSAAVSGWPGLEIKAYRMMDRLLEPGEEALQDHKLTLLRMDRLAPDVMLCIFNDIPTVVDVEQPREGLQFGTDQALDDNGYELKLRHMRGPRAGYQLGQPVPGQPGDGFIVDRPNTRVRVPVRRDRRDVIHVAELNNRLYDDLLGRGLIDNRGPNGSVRPAEMAVQMSQYPYRQRFQGEGRAQENQPISRFTSMYVHATFIVADLLPAISASDVMTLFSVPNP
jgi:hypothetical protein